MSPFTVIVSVLAISVGNPISVFPHARDYFSENGQFVVRVTPTMRVIPTEKGSKSWFEKPWFEVFQVQGDERVSLWRCDVGNKTCPGRAYVSNDGTCVVTKNEWNTGGLISTYGDYVLAFYQKTGLIRSYSSAEIIQCQGYIHFGRTWASETYLRDIEGRALLCIWPWDKPDYWLVWDVSTGNKVNVFPETTEACNKIARQWALNRLMQTEQRHDEVYLALSILGRLNVPEDRERVASFLDSEDFISGDNKSSNGVFQGYNAYSSIRNAAERALTAWDGTPVERSGGTWQTHDYLGAVRGAIKLPRVPETDDWPFSIHLIPAASPKGHWYHERYPYRLHARFSKSSQPGSASIPFAFYQVTPGRYHVQAVWDVAEPHSFYVDKVTGPPAPGDYESQLAPLVDVRAGECTEGVLLECTQPVSEASTTRWASECLPRSSPVIAACPCGQEHHVKRVCLVFDQPMPMTAFDHGPYHNFGGASLTQDGGMKTYSYSFAKEEQGLSETEKRQFDMGIQMVIVNDKLTRVTVEGPYFAVVPMSSFLRALSIDTTGLDDSAMESYTIHGKLMPRIWLPESLHRVTQILGRPSTTRGDEVTFSYNHQELWIKWETSSNGLVLKCRTNLAGGTSFFGYSPKDVM